MDRFMESLQEMAELVVDLTCADKVLVLDVERRNEAKGYTEFRLERGDRGLIVRVTSRDIIKVRRLHEKRFKVIKKGLGELRDCIFAHLVPNMRVFGVLKGVLEERLTLELNDGAGPRKCLCLSGDRPKLRIWLDEEDRLKISGSCVSEEVQTFELDDEALVEDPRYYFFEDPFLEEEEGSHPTLLPKTMEVVSLVLGTWSLNNLDQWAKAADAIPRAPAVMAKARSRSLHRSGLGG